MSGWVDVARIDDLGPGEGRSVTVNGVRIALFNDDGAIHALDDSCPHQGAPLSEGLLHDGRVICPWHSWVFELHSGECPRGSHEPVRSHRTRCLDGTVQVFLSPDEPEPAAPES